MKKRGNLSETSKKIKVIIAIAISVLMLNVQSAFAKSVLKISPRDNSHYTVTIDRYSYSIKNQDIELRNLSAGSHRIKVVKVERRHYPAPVHYHVVFNGMIDIPQNSRVTARLSDFDGLEIIRTEKIYAVDMNNIQTQNECIPQESGYSSFERLIDVLNNESFDSGKLKIAKQYARSNSISSRKVKRIMDTFSFESTKLEFAKFSFHYVADPQNFFLVNDSFSFSSSIDKLDKYILECTMY